MTLYRCQSTTTTAQKTNCMPHNATLTCSLYIYLGKIRRHVVDVLTIYPYHSVSSIDTLYLVWIWCLCCTWYLLVPWPAYACFSFYRIAIVLSLSLPIYRNSVGTLFLIVPFPNDNTETFCTISTTNVHILRFFDSIPTIFLSTFLAVLV